MSRLGRRARRHAPFLVLLVIGLILRGMAWDAFRPAILLLADTVGYLQDAILGPSGKQMRPYVYPLFLKALLGSESLGLVTFVQHLLAVAMAAGIYLLLYRLRVHPAIAAIGVAPLLLDGYQINLEQHILSETLFESFIVGALLLVAWRSRPPVWMLALAGVAVGLGALTRFAGLALLPVVLLYLLVRRVGWRALAMPLALVLTMVTYATWNERTTGQFALTDASGQFLYAGKVSRFAECEGVPMPELERQLCIDVPPSERLEVYPPWVKASPLMGMSVPPGVEKDAVVRSFSKRMIKDQPLGYARLVATDFLRFFSLESPPEQQALRVSRWRFFEKLRQVKAVAGSLQRSRGNPPPELGLQGGFRIDRDTASFLRSYQDRVYQHGSLMIVFVLLSVGGVIFGRGRREERDTRWDAALFTLAALALFAFPSVFSTFHYRYVIPSIPLLGPGAALGATLLYRRFALRGTVSQRAAAEPATA